jgi:hypothetical protein
MSRLDSLAALRRTDLGGFKQIFSLSSMAEIEEPQTESTEDILFEPTGLGLHAKLYVADQGWKAHVWTGSANATSAAFHQNIEFLVELIGSKKDIGVDVFLQQTKERAGFADLWEVYKPSNDLVQVDQVQKQLEELLRKAHTAVVSCHWHGRVDPASQPGEFLLQTSSEYPCTLAPEVRAMYWLLSLSSGNAFTLDTSNPTGAMFGPMALESLSAFMVFQLTARIGERSIVSQFVLRIPLEGVPDNRQEHLLRAMLKNQDQVMRFLLFILMDGREDMNGNGTALLDVLTAENSDFPRRSQVDKPLFESLVQALHHDPIRLDQIARTIADLERTPEGARMIPEGFHEIWQPIWEARQGIL